ncbi:hypothetical protein NBRC116592_30180 [Colwellia sp. KU-HH00111]|uniref:amidohydrolase family protein n=1 Tax=Colwellia sp. KU-HH00111 TaxID=3127652 RepID=UPI00310AFDD2
MSKNIAVILIILSLVAFFLWLPEPEIKQKQSNNNTTIITQTNLFDGESWLPETDIVFSKGLIIAMGSNLVSQYPQAKIINGKGKTIIPGLIDAHTHAWGDALTKAVKFGVTTELDMFTNNIFAITQRELRQDNQKNSQQADLFSAGTLVTAPNGHGTEYGFKIPTIKNASQAEMFVSSRVEEGSDYIKIVYNANAQGMPSINQETLQAVIASAQSRGKLAVVHISNYPSALDAIKAGANGLVHSFMDKTDMSPLVNLMAKNSQFIIPTLSVMDSMAGAKNSQQLLSDFEKQGFDLSAQKTQLSTLLSNKHNASASAQAKHNVNTFLDAGVLILAGTDAPNPGTAHGISLHGELALLVQSGLTPTQALKAATSNPAKAFNLTDRGLLKVGMKADLVLLDDDPKTNINNTRKIHAIFKNGFKIEKAVNTLETKKITQAIKLGDFDTSLMSGLSTQWMITTDEMFKGKSTAQFVLATSATGAFIHITGEIDPQFSFPWAGIYLPLTPSTTQGLDISSMKGINFKAKGKVGDYKLLLFSTHQPMRPIEIIFTVTASWNDIHLSLAQVPQGLLQSISAVALVAGKTHDEVNMSFDDIWLQ